MQQVQLSLQDLKGHYAGLNIEGWRPTTTLPPGCTWYNLVQVVDDPLAGSTFEHVMHTVKETKLDFIEPAVGIDIDAHILNLTERIRAMKGRHKNLLVHVHQYEGTTRLAAVLEHATGVRCILDKTNFFESPVNYAEEYPDIDALFSISQCAGIGLPPGTLLFPNRFHHLNIEQGTIDVANEINVSNALASSDSPCTFLVADELWNPQPDDVFLCLSARAARTLAFVKENTKHFDASHNAEHALAVARNATGIFNDELVLLLALLHDVCDHKYPDALPREKLTQWMHAEYPTNMAFFLDDLIDRVSFRAQLFEEVRSTWTKVDNSAQIPSIVRPAFSRMESAVLTAVRDGDRMEAIGAIGVLRCRAYLEARGSKDVDADFVRHAEDKLLRLVPERFIVHHTPEVLRRHAILVKAVHAAASRTNKK